MSQPSLPNSFRYSISLLEEYRLAALENANILIDEAALLFDHGFIARSYFLAVAAIEEVGKSSIAFEAIGRNLQDSAITAKLKRSFERHSTKINAAFHAAILNEKELRQIDVNELLKLMSALTQGREPSMYIDIDYSSGEIEKPNNLVREVAAKDCIRLAKSCYLQTKERQNTSTPIARSADDDAFYSMMDKRIKRLFDSEDFHLFLIKDIDSGERDISASIAFYEKNYLNKNRKFQ